MGTVGRVIAIVAGIIGILAVLLYMVMPDFFAFWRFDAYGFAPADFKVWIGGFAQKTGEGYAAALDSLGITEGTITYTEDEILTVIAIAIIAGGALSIIGGIIGNKWIALVGGIAMLLGVLAFTIGLLIQFGDFSNLGDLIDVFGGDNLLMGSGSSAPLDADWGLGMAAWFGYGAAAGGIIGGALSGD